MEKIYRLGLYLLLLFVLVGQKDAHADFQEKFTYEQNATGARGQNVDFIGQIGGSSFAVAALGNYVYLGEGPRVTILDNTDPSNVVVIGKSAPFHELIYDLAPAGDYLYLANWNRGLQIVDVSNPGIPTEVGFYDTPGWAQGVAVEGEYAYVADRWFSGMRVVDVSDPSNPIEVGIYDTPDATDVAIGGDYAYVADHDLGLRVVDISDPSNPTEVGFYDTPGNAMGVAVEGDYAYVADMHEGLRVVDVTDPSNPTEVGFYNSPGIALSVKVVGDYVYVADSAAGLRIVIVEDPSSPTELGFLDTPGSARSVTVAGDYAYVADRNSGMRVVDILDPSNPSEVDFYITIGYAQDVAITGDYAYVAARYLGLRIAEISDPTSPAELGKYNTPGIAHDITSVGNLAFIADGNAGLRIIDVTDPILPVEIGFIETFGFAKGVVIVGSYAYIADGIFGLLVIDVTEPSNPTFMGFYNTPGDAIGVAVAGNYAFVADDEAGLRILNIADPTNPSEVGSYDTPGSAQEVAVAGDYAYIADGNTGLRIVNIADPTNPIEVGFLTAPGNARDVAVAENHAYVVDGWNGMLLVVDVTNPSSPNYVGTYDMPGDGAGVTVAGDLTYVADGEGGLVILEYTGRSDTTTMINKDDPDPSLPGETITTTVQVTSLFGIPTGVVTVTVSDRPESCLFTLLSGSGSCGVEIPVAGTFTLTASYSGDNSFFPSSDTELHTVAPFSTSTTITADDPDPSLPGQPFTVTADVDSAFGVPTGLASVTVSNRPESCMVELEGGSGSCGLDIPVVGTYTLTTTYSGDSIFAPSSDTELHTVTPFSTSTTITADDPDPSLPDQPLTVTVGVESAFGVPTGLVTMTISNRPESCMVELEDGTGSCGLEIPVAGTYTLTALYGGDSLFSLSSDTDLHTVEPFSTVTTITADDPDPSLPGQTLFISFEVFSIFEEPTGSVTVNVEGRTESCSGILVDGMGMCELVLSEAGIYDLIATYSGDQNHMSSSAVEKHTVASSAGIKLFLPLVQR